MSKKKRNLKAIVLSLGLMAAMLPATTVNAQALLGKSLIDEYYDEQDANQGGLLRSGSSGGYDLNNGNFGNGGYNLNNGTFGQDSETPLGSGLFILAAAGAGYALTKRKSNSKKN